MAPLFYEVSTIGGPIFIYIVAFWEKTPQEEQEEAEQSSQDADLDTCFRKWRQGMDFQPDAENLSRGNFPEDRPLRIVFHAVNQHFAALNGDQLYVRTTWKTSRENILCQEPRAVTALGLHAQLCLTPNVQCCKTECLFQQMQEVVLRWLSHVTMISLNALHRVLCTS